MRQLGHDALHVLGGGGLEAVGGEARALGLHDRDLVLEAARVVGADLRAEAVLERRDDPAAVRIVLGVGARHDVEVEGQAHLVAADLDIALLHDVQEADLDPLGEVRQLVDREDAAVRARQETVVDGQLVGEVAPLGHLDRVHLTDQIGDGDVRRGELLAVAAVAREPDDAGGVALVREALPAGGADRREGRVVDLAAREGGHLVVEQADEQTRHARFRLPALAEEHDVLAGEDRVLDLREDALLVADDPREDRLAALEPADQVVAQFLLDRRRLVPAVPELSDGRRLGHAQ